MVTKRTKNLPRHSQPRSRSCPRTAPLGAAALCLLLFWLEGGLPAQEASVSAQVEALVPLLEEREGESYWSCVNRLERLGQAAVPYLRNRLSSGGPRSRLGCAKALLFLGDPEGRREALEALGKLAQDARTPHVQIDAIQLFGLHHDDPDEVLPVLEKVFDEAVDPKVVIPLARTLWEVDHVARARDRLVELLKSQDPEVRNEAALALAELDYFEGDVREILRSLKDEPGPRGRRAAALERVMRLTRQLERRVERGTLVPEGTDMTSLVEIKEKRIRELEDRLERARRGDAGGGTRPWTLEDRLLEEVIRVVEQNYVDDRKARRDSLLLAAVRGMVRALDEYSTFMDPEESRLLTESLEGKYAGIGAQVSKRLLAPLEIVRPTYDGPAHRAGLLSGDQVLEVNGVPTRDLQLEEITRELKGEEGTEVTLKVWRRGWSEPREFTIERRVVNVPSVYSQLLPGGIGYILLTQFGYESAEDFVKALGELEAQGLQALIFDLRNNPGGLLTAAVKIADLFVEGDLPIVTQKGRGDPGENEIRKMPTAGARTGYPMVVLVNGRSASAAEVVSGALRDYDRAVLVGQRTFGKGSVQNIMPLKEKEDCKLKLTVQYYYLPHGTCIHTIRDERGRVVSQGGVEPDVTVSSAALPAGRIEDRVALRGNARILEYVDRHLEELKALVPLGDRGREDAYPQFDELYAALEDRPSKDDVKAVIRQEVRQRLEDRAGRYLPVDLEEDRQLQVAVREVLERLGLQATPPPEYAWIPALAAEEAAREGDGAGNPEADGADSGEEGAPAEPPGGDPGASEAPAEPEREEGVRPEQSSP